MIHIIGLGECKVSRAEGDSIKTYALASCVGLVVYNKRDRVLGMVHIVLPDKKETDGPAKGEGFYADTAVPLLFNQVFGKYPEEKSSYQVSLFGGCSSRNKADVFNVGERNIAKIEQILSSHNIRYAKDNTGGHYSRTIEAFVNDGSVNVHLQKMLI